ncbi:MAG: protein kinase [Acidobacteriota bacterium]
MIQQTFSHYRIIKKLGAGGMGEVYLADDTQLDRKVAIKLLPPESTADEQGKKRLVREAKAAAKLDHPNICAIYEVGEEDGRSFIVMQYVEGETLANRIQRKQLELRESLDIAVQVADALAEAHSRGIIHRDIKPQNVMVTARGQAKVMDFGLARVVQQRSLIESYAETESLLTLPGVVVGTVPYMSPEQVRGEELDARSDIFSFGALLYELVAGRRPFAAESAAETIAAIQTREAPPLARYAHDVPAELQRIVTKALAKDRERRYQTIQDVAIDLDNARKEYEAGRATSQQQGQWTQGGVAAVTNEAAAPRVSITTSSAEYLVSEIKRHKLAALIGLVIAAIAIAGLAAYLNARNTEVAIESIAVLPFENQNHDPNTEYLSDGLTESIINSLTQLPDLRVIARSSVFRYKGRDTDPMAAGRELGVRAVLTGRIMQRGDNLNVSAELVDVRDNKQLWGEQYERKVSDLLGVQREIAKEISGNLRLKLSGAEQSRVTKHYTENPEAYQLYLKGRYFWNKFTPADHLRAAEYFNQAIAKDPTYALAYTGLADTYGASASYSWIAPTEGYPKAKALAKKALELDETLAEAHAALGALTMFYDLDWAAAEREYKRAIELNPNYPITYELYSYLLSVTGRLDEGIAMAKRGLEVDPLSVPLADDTGQAYYWARRYDEAIKQYQKSIEMDPNHPLVGLGAVYEQKGMYDEAIAAYQKAIKASERTSNILGALGHAYAASGRRGEALKILDELKEMSKQKYVSPYDMAVLYTGLGEKDRAIEQLNKAYEERAGWVISLKVEPLFDPLRSDPRFADLVRRMSL